jgi:hypothetical protein
MYKTSRIILTSLACSYFIYYANTYTDWHFIDNVDLIFHEAGHTIFFFLGEYVQVLAGSAFQIILPFLISLYFLKNKQKISSSLCLAWTGQNILNVSIYAGDAIKMNLDLLGGDSVIHDWHYLLREAYVLQYTDTIAKSIYSS